MKKRVGDASIVIVIAIVIAVAAVTGSRRSVKSDLEFMESVIKPGLNCYFENPNKGLLTEENGDITAHIYSGEEKGYNGNVRVAAITDTSGRILSIHINSDKETPSFVEKIYRRNFSGRFVGLRAMDMAEERVIVDAVAGATITSNAVIKAIINGYMEGEGMVQNGKVIIRAGWPEYVVLTLFFLSVLISVRRLRAVSRYLKWISWGLSIVFLGFVLGQPLTLPRFITLAGGYLPDTNGELYILLIPVLSIGFILFTGKNNYCRSVCPFGATQEFLGALGKASDLRLKKYRLAKYLQWGTALSAVLIALALNNPSVAEYSVFGTFFQLTGPPVLFVLLMLTVIMSMFFRRPWCRYLCPVDGVMAYFRTLRRVIINTVKK